MKDRKWILFFIIGLFIFFSPYCYLKGEEESIYLTLRLLDDGKLEENVRFNDMDFYIKEFYADKSWQQKEEKSFVITRKISSIESYTELNDAFPLEVQVKKHILWDNYIIKANYGKNKLVDELTAHADKIVFSLQMPGIINETSAAKKEGNTLTWLISSEKRPDIYVNAMVIDGFRLAVFILGIGILLAFGYFISAVLKVNRIIEEEYSLETVKMPETDENNQK